MRFTRKLEIGHWNQGKGCKGSRKAKLRVVLDTEIDNQIAEQDENYRTRHVSKGTPNLEARLKHRIEWYEQRVVEHERRAKHDKHCWSCSWASYARQTLREARQELKELQEKANELRP